MKLTVSLSSQSKVNLAKDKVLRSLVGNLESDSLEKTRDLRQVIEDVSGHTLLSLSNYKFKGRYKYIRFLTHFDNVNNEEGFYFSMQLHSSDDKFDAAFSSTKNTAYLNETFEDSFTNYAPNMKSSNFSNFVMLKTIVLGWQCELARIVALSISDDDVLISTSDDGKVEAYFNSSELIAVKQGNRVVKTMVKVYPNSGLFA